MKRFQQIVFVLLSLFTAVVDAQEQRTYMSKTEVQQVFAGKVFSATEIDSGRLVRWTFKEDGQAYFNGVNPRGKQIEGSGNWAVGDGGAMCLTWSGRAGEPNCFFVFKANDQLEGTRTSEPLAPVFFHIRGG